MRVRSMWLRASALLLACLASAAARAESMDELYDQAKREGAVVLYGAGPAGSHDRWIREFEQRFPAIKVAHTGGLSPQLNAKVDAQLAAGRMETDLAILQTIQDFGRWKQKGAMLLFRPEGSDAIDAAYKDEDG